MTRTRFVRNLKLGIRSLLLHKLRSVLTMLGVVFGVASVIAMLAIGEGTKRKEIEQYERLGTNNIIINSRKPTETGASTGSGGGFAVLTYGIQYEDRDRIHETLKTVKRTVPVRSVRKDARVDDRSRTIDVVGTTADWFDLIRREVLAGRTINEHDQRNIAPVIVLTEELARDLLVTSHTIGQPIQIGEKVFTVVGIVRSESRAGEVGGTLDEGKDAFIPLSTCRHVFGEMVVERAAGSLKAEIIDLHQLIVEVSARQHVIATAEVVQTMLERFHDERDFEVRVPLELLRRVEQVQGVWNRMLGSIAGISLLVGGIGIMNIMLASVTERTREIGIRRAIGARRGQIVSQFLTEALLLSITGGLVGIALGVWGLPRVLSQWSAGMGEPIDAIVPAYAIPLSAGISVLIGVAFGMYPALRAARLDPIVALRHE